MLDDEVTIMNEISRPPPPPPPDREGGRRQDTWDRDRQNRGNSEGGRNMRRKDGGRGFNDRKRENNRESEQMGYSGNITNQVQMGMGRIDGNLSLGRHDGNMGMGGGGGSINMGASSSRSNMTMGNIDGGNVNMGGGGRNMSVDGGNMNMGAGNMNPRGGGGMNMAGSGGNMNMGLGVGTGMSSMASNLDMGMGGPGMSNVSSMPMQISPTSQNSQWMPNMSQLPMPGMAGPNMSTQSIPGPVCSMSSQMSSMPSMSLPTTSMSQTQPTMQNMPPSMMGQVMPNRGPEGQMGSMMPGMDSMNSQMMGPMVDPGPGPCPMMDPATGQMMPPWTLPSMVGPDGQLVKQPITYRLSVLYPPNPQAPPPTTRERPPGCRTVFIGGLPENAVEEHVVDVFAKCGEIQTVRMSKKNFCHIRYCAEYCVDNAIYLSGWRMRIDNCSDGPNTGRLHVDFAQARDDLYEWECKQRASEREARHRTRIIEDMNRTPSPPPVVHFSDHEAHTVTEEIRAENLDRIDNWGMAMDTLMTWLERGDCNKRNAHTFYTMIQVASSHVKRLLGEQTEYEQELSKMKEDFRKKMSSISVQFSQIERVFGSAGKQKVWDHFTKAQRKNLTTWKKQLQDVQTLTKEHSMVEEDMDLEDDQEKEEPLKKRKKCNPDKLREESEEWACQAQTYRNEVESVKADMKSELETKEQQIKILQQTLQGMQLQLLEAQKKSGNLPGFLMDSQEKKNQAKPPVKIQIAQEEKHEAASEENKLVETPEDDKIVADESKVEDTYKIKIALAGEDARLVAVISTFLNVHPFGAGADYIWSYLLRVDPSIKYKEVEQLMEKYSTCFKMEVEGVGANMARTWKLIAFKPE